MDQRATLALLTRAATAARQPLDGAAALAAVRQVLAECERDDVEWREAVAAKRTVDERHRKRAERGSEPAGEPEHKGPKTPPVDRLVWRLMYLWFRLTGLEPSPKPSGRFVSFVRAVEPGHSAGGVSKSVVRLKPRWQSWQRWRDHQKEPSPLSWTDILPDLPGRPTLADSTRAIEIVRALNARMPQEPEPEDPSVQYVETFDQLLDFLAALHSDRP